MKNLKRTFIYSICTSFVAFTACTSNNDFTKGKTQLENQGYTNVKNTGYNMFCCDDNDTFSTGFEALDINGNKIEGCFCSSLLKGVTIRFE